jgi:hypothetical protein
MKINEDILKKVVESITGVKATDTTTDTGADTTTDTTTNTTTEQ